MVPVNNEQGKANLGKSQALASVSWLCLSQPEHTVPPAGRHWNYLLTAESLKETL